MRNESVEKLVKAIRNLKVAVTAMGYMCGVYSGEAFESTAKHLVEDLLKAYRVEKWSYYDEQGYVYGYPTTIHVDVLVRDHEHIVVEYKAHADRGDVAELYRIAQLYEKATGVKPKALLVAPTITRRAKELAEKLSIEVRGTIVS